MRILAISDETAPSIYSPRIRDRFGDIDMVLGCGDLSYLYMEYVVTMLCVPSFYVHGNHDQPTHLSDGQLLSEPGGWENLDGRTVKTKELIIGGLEGSVRYKPQGRYQYTEGEMRLKAWGMVPSLMMNHLLHERHLDILITHAPPRGIHDGSDAAHRGFETFLWLMRRFRPRYLLHGHQHLYAAEQWQTQYLDTTVINVYPFRVIDLDLDDT
jgi:Icc-related predicted phosphoesterase